MGNADVTKIASVMESLVPEKGKRRHFLSIFLEAINHANSLGSNKWGVQCVDEEEKVRLLVGSFIVLTIGKGRLWLALDEELLKTKEKVLSLENSDQWQWDKDDYPTYKRVLSRNGYYISSQNNFELWSKIKELHFEFINKVANRYSWLLVTSQSKHQPALLLYLRQELKQFVPDPNYNQEQEARIPEEIEEIDSYYEGAKTRITVNAYERDKNARQKCVKHFGINCYICGFNFEEQYGEIGKGFIHVHHLKPLSEIGEKYKLNPTQDLLPVCPNCHSMLHKRKPPYSVEELRNKIKGFKQ
jgi:5-methylcytosine-specific restriction protein A